VLNTCLKRSLFVLHLSVKRGQASLYPPTEQAPLLLGWKTWKTQMEKTIPCFFFFFVFAFHHRKGGKSSCTIEKTPCFSLSILLIYIHIHNVVLTVSEEDPGR
jgi:hypothetical protein